MDLEEVKNLIEILENSNINSIMVQEKDTKIKLEKTPSSASAVQYVAPNMPQMQTLEQTSPLQKKGEIITSPMVGTFYEAPTPNADPFVKVGEIVSQGDKLCILEAMKIFNEIEADFTCKILEVLVKDGQIVEFDTPLFRVEKI